MSLNELCTNAAKHGALSNATGRVDITSAVDEKTQRFKLTWTEKGGRRSRSRRGTVLGRVSSIAWQSSFRVMFD
jgi:two-component sensor histidine kinase